MSNFIKGFKVKYKTRSPWHVHEQEDHFHNKDDAERFAEEQKKTSESL